MLKLRKMSWAPGDSIYRAELKHLLVWSGAQKTFAMLCWAVFHMFTFGESQMMQWCGLLFLLSASKHRVKSVVLRSAILWDSLDLMIILNGCVMSAEYEAILQDQVHPVEQKLLSYPRMKIASHTHCYTTWQPGLKKNKIKLKKSTKTCKHRFYVWQCTQKDTQGRQQRRYSRQELQELQFLALASVPCTQRLPLGKNKEK